MPRRVKKAGIQALRASEARLAPQPAGENLKAMIERLVRERVDEIVSKPGVMTAPLLADFQPQKVACEIRRRQTMFERRKWSLYFERWGCRRCDTKEKCHASNGHCNSCQRLLLDHARTDSERRARYDPRQSKQSASTGGL